MKRILVLLVLGCYGVVGRLHGEFLEVAGLLKSHASGSFSSENEFVQKAQEFQALVHAEASKLTEVAHPHIVRVGDNCDHDCWDLLREQFGNDAVSILKDKHYSVTASVSSLNKLATEHPDVIKYHMVMLPEMKVDHEVVKLAGAKGNTCFPSTTHMRNNRLAKGEAPEIIKRPKSIALRVIMIPLQSGESEDFHGYVKILQNQHNIAWDYSKYIPGKERTLEITLSSCDKVAHVAQALSRRREVFWVELVHPAYTHNRWSNGVCDSGKGEVSPLQTNPSANFTGWGDVIGVTDTGIDMKNCFFRDDAVDPPYVWSDESSAATISHEHRKLVQYYMLRKGNGDRTDGIDDFTGHGTHVAGIAAGRVENAYGDYLDYAGMVTDAKIAFFDIGDPTSSDEGESLILPDNLNTDLFSVMYESGARIFTNSWGTAANNYDTRAKEVDQFMWQHKDALVLFSAGNSGGYGNGPNGDGTYTTGSPSTNKNGVSVGATLNDHDSWQFYEGDKTSEYGVDALAGFSSQGPTQDNRMKPDVLAPGFWVTSAKGKPNSTANFCELQALRGTSMACPTAAGFAMKIRRYFLDGFYPGGVRDESAGFTPSGALLKAMLVHSAQRVLYSVERDTHEVTDISDTYPSNLQGYGRIDMSKVLNFAAASTSPINLYVLGAVDTSSPHYVEFNLANRGTPHMFGFSTTDDTSPIRVTLSYTDQDGAAVTIGSPLVNKLEVSVTDNWGNSFSPYLADGMTRDNTQVVDIATPLPFTTYTVTVECTSNLLTAQPYAMVITGKLTYLDNVEYTENYSIPADNFTASGGALKYILALGILTLVLSALVWFFHRVSKRKTSMMLDPRDFEATDDFYEEEVQDTGRGGRKSVFATIRNIRSNHRKAQQRGGDVENAEYYQ